MGCTVEELQGRMDSREFTAWLGYAQAFRMPQQRVEQGLKRVEVLLQHYLAMFANANKKKGKRSFKAEDFELKPREEASRDSLRLETDPEGEKQEEPWRKVWKTVGLIHAGIEGRKEKK